MAQEKKMEFPIMTTKKSKLEERKARVAMVIEGHLPIEELTPAELDLKDAALAEISMAEALEEVKYLQPHQFH